MLCVRRPIRPGDDERRLALGGKRDVLRQDRVEDLLRARAPEMSRPPLSRVSSYLRLWTRLGSQ